MARVEIEERAWSDPRLKDLAFGLKTTTSFAMGVLAALWHDSQEQGKEVIEERHLRVWFAAEIKKKKDVIGALISAGYVEKLPDGTLRVDGNGRRCERVTVYKTRAKTAIDARWKRQKDLQNQKREQTPPDTTSILARTSSSTGQVLPTENREQRDMLTALKNASLREADEPAAPLAHDARAHGLDRADAPCDELLLETQAANGNARTTDGDRPGTAGNAAGGNRRARRPKNAGEPTPGAQTVIAAFVTAWGQAYPQRDGTPGKYPVSGKDAGAAKALVKAIGVEKTVALIPAFLEMRTAFLIAKRHALPFMSADLPSVVDFAASGKLITSIAARKEEGAAHADNFVERYMARDAAKKAANGSGADSGPVIDVEAKEAANDPW